MNPSATLVRDALRQHGRLSVKDLQTATSLSETAVRDALKGLLSADNAAHVEGTRPAEYVAVEPASLPALVDEATDHGSRIVSGLERVWDAIRAKHPLVPAAVIVTGSGRKRQGIVLGHHAAGRWTDPDERGVTEIFLSGERLGDGPQGVLSTLLHEAAHGLNHARGIKDTSNGRYHNKQFIAAAQEMGLTTVDAPHPSIGYSYTECPDETFEEYREALVPLAEAMLAIGKGTGYGKGAGGGLVKVAANGGEAKATSGRLTKVVCECEEPRILRLSRKAIDAGPIVCGVCAADFKEEV